MDGHREMAEQILRSDRIYFEMAATVGVMRGAELAWMPGLQKLAGGCMVQRINTSMVEGGYRLWLRGIEASIGNLGGGMVRLYLKEENPTLEREMRQAGFRRRLEIAYLLDPHEQSDGGDLFDLQEVTTDDDWRIRRLVQEKSGLSPDGYEVKPAEWVLLERRKCRTGGMKMFLINRDGEVLGSVGLIRIGELLRCRNLTLRLDCGGDVGAGVLRQLASVAGDEQLRGVGDLVIAGSVMEGYCQEAGMRPVGRLSEWAKQLN